MAEGANQLMEEENVVLRQQLAQVQQQLQAIRDPSPPATTPTQVPHAPSPDALNRCKRGPPANRL